MNKGSWMKILLGLTLFLSNVYAQNIWQRGVEINSPRENIFELESNELNEVVEAGKIHALDYPVSVTGLLIPIEPLAYFFGNEQDPLRRYIFRKLKKNSPIKSIDEMFKWLGLNKFPENTQLNPLGIPEVSEQMKQYPMGTTFIDVNGTKGMTFSCAACHSSNLFGKKILGMTNRFPRANEYFYLGKQAAPFISSHMVKFGLNTSEGERKMISNSLKAIRWVGVKKPQALGLDTSLAQVGLSLARRVRDDYATKTRRSALFPRKSKLDKVPADSKPAVWWNLKYKNRWLSDGSIVSGNPIFTNFLWNEIGRGTDLRVLEKWMQENQQTIKELTAAVFATKAPTYESFFPGRIDKKMAMDGEKIYLNSCKGCHGSYEKDWSRGVETVAVHYPKQTKVKDVGTDPYRYQGMKYFAQELNQLKISKWMKTIVEPQKGYVPPPLVGIWARWPYFHNNSIANLCELMTPPNKRVKNYYSHEALNPETDYDHDCLGYPLDEKTQKAWEFSNHLFNTSKLGLSNSGHYYRIFTDKQGQEKFTDEQKRSLREYLKTL
jgi:hypothetical protein